MIMKRNFAMGLLLSTLLLVSVNICRSQEAPEPPEPPEAPDTALDPWCRPTRWMETLGWVSS